MFTDIRTNHPLLAKLPSSWQPYILIARLDRPVGIWLLLIPCLWGLSLSSRYAKGITPDLWRYVALFTIGAVLMRAVGCIINDLLDKDLDARVMRTQSRPLPSGHMSVRQAQVFLLALLLPSLCILLSMNTLTIILGLISIPLVLIYPLMKRITWWPQAF